MPELPLRDATFTVFDFETTGLYPYNGDAICEIGAVRMRGGDVTGTFGTLVNPMRPISPGASAVNGITDDMVRDAPTLGRIYPEFTDFLGDSFLAAHNAPFDIGFFAAAAKNLDCPPLQNPVFDTLRLSRLLDPAEASHSLHKLRIRHGIDVESEHRAVGDAVATAKLLSRFLERLVVRGIATIEALTDFHGGAFYVETPKFLADAANEVPPDSLEPIRQAIIGGRRIKIEYTSSGGAVTARIIEPQDIVRRGTYYYLAAQCHLRGEGRTFRLDRIRNILHVD